MTVFKVSPVSGQSTAESEARKIEPLSTIVTCVALAAWSEFSGADADGREVVIVSDMLERFAAFTLDVKKNPKIRIKLTKISCFLITPVMYYY